MSNLGDDPGLTSGAGQETGAPAEGGAPDIGQGEPEATPSPDYLDLDQYAGHHVRVKVDGQEIEVPLSEALGGYSRQADYTRKTQELAEAQRQAQFGLTLQQALEANPAETLRILQSQYANQQQAEPEPDWTDDPVESRFREYEQRLERWEAQQASTELRQALGVLQQRYGEEFDARAVVERASQLNRIDLEAVYKEMAFDRYWQGQQAAREQLAKDDAARTEAKTQAANMHSGNGATNTASPDTGSYPTIEDAYYAAKRQLGVS